MKAVVVHQYGGPEVLKFEEYPDPIPGAGEVLVRVAATSINPFDIMRRSGSAKDVAPIKFPGIVGVDVSGTVLKIGPRVEGFSIGDRVFAMADQTYAELCLVKATTLAKIPEELDVADAAALPLAVFTAKARGAVVIAGVLKRQLQEAASLGAEQVVATDDDNAIANLPLLDAVADAVGGKAAEKLIARVKQGGVFASVLGALQNAKEYPTVKVVPVYAQPDTKVLLYMAQAVKDGKLVIPIGQRLPLRDAEKAHAAAAKGGVGKLLLVADEGR